MPKEEIDAWDGWVGSFFTRVKRICDNIGHYRNVRGLGKSIAVFRLFEKLRYSNERSTIEGREGVKWELGSAFFGG